MITRSEYKAKELENHSNNPNFCELCVSLGLGYPKVCNCKSGTIHVIYEGEGEEGPILTILCDYCENPIPLLGPIRQLD